MDIKQNLSYSFLHNKSSGRQYKTGPVTLIKMNMPEVQNAKEKQQHRTLKYKKWEKDHDHKIKYQNRMCESER